MTHRPETISLAQNTSFLGPSTERIEKVAQNFLEGNEDPDFEVEVLDVLQKAKVNVTVSISMLGDSTFILKECTL